MTKLPPKYVQYLVVNFLSSLSLSYIKLALNTKVIVAAIDKLFSRGSIDILL